MLLSPVSCEFCRHLTVCVLPLALLGVLGVKFVLRDAGGAGTVEAVLQALGTVDCLCMGAGAWW